MARWKLLSAHYLSVPGVEWEYKETSQETGKQVRRVFAVPQYLHPDDPGDHNYPGEIIVTNGGSRQPRDIEFVGAPTPEMDPLDDEARAQTEEEKRRWKTPFEDFRVVDYNQSLIDNFQKQMFEVMAGAVAKPVAPVPASAISAEDFAALQAQVATLVEQNAQLQTQLARRRG